MDRTDILQKTEMYVKNLLKGEGSGHDWWHIHRVREMAIKISKKEGGDKFLIEMVSLLHDVDDYKLGLSNKRQGNALSWLKKQKLPIDNISQIILLINEVSFKGNEVADTTTSVEADIVQDADRLDAIGALGIARAFAYGGTKNRLLYQPGELPALHYTFEDYKSNKSSTINHFYEKLLLLKERMKTETAKKIAINRHKFMENYLNQFFNEWNAKL